MASLRYDLELPQRFRLDKKGTLPPRYNWAALTRSAGDRLCFFV